MVEIVSPRKLSETDKHDIINSYRHSPETTSTLASRYEVSSSTISRFLKSTLPPEEYEKLIEQKRIQAAGKVAEVGMPEAQQLELTAVKIEPIPSVVEKPEKVKQRLTVTKAEINQVKSKVMQVVAEPPIVKASSQPEIAEIRDEITAEALAQPVAKQGIAKAEVSSQAEIRVLEEMLGEDSIDIADEDDDDEDDDDEDDDDEDDDDEDDDDDDEDDLREEDWETETAYRHRPLVEVGVNIQVLPLSESSLPKMCYLVVDKSAELIVKPLKEFSDLGNIPSTEIQQKTLPVFHNHRIALRFSNRSQKVIKVPDGRILHKTRSYLQAKGITRLLINGQVYSL
jgi:hypothetical protein